MKNDNLTNAVSLAARILLALLFVLSGYGKITGYDGTAGYMASAGVPFVGLLLPLTILVELGGGLLLIAGFKTRWVALGIALFLVPVTIIFHGHAADPSQAQMQFIMFMKNVSIIGGMLSLVAFGAGGWSIDGRKAA
jgi:putative oxidoreductase